MFLEHAKVDLINFTESLLECGCKKNCTCGDKVKKTVIAGTGDMIVDKKKAVVEGIGRFVKPVLKFGAGAALVGGGVSEYKHRSDENFAKSLTAQDSKTKSDMMTKIAYNKTAKAAYDKEHPHPVLNKIDKTIGTNLSKDAMRKDFDHDVKDVAQQAHNARPSVAIPKFVKSIPDRAKAWYKNNPSKADISNTKAKIARESFYEDDPQSNFNEGGARDTMVGAAAGAAIGGITQYVDYKFKIREYTHQIAALKTRRDKCTTAQCKDMYSVDISTIQDKVDNLKQEAIAKTAMSGAGGALAGYAAGSPFRLFDK